MALHRDIYWVGRQWAITGHGMQAVDQRLRGAFDIEVLRLWDEGLTQRIRAHSWVNAEDFDKALAIARKRFPAPPQESPSLVDSVLELIKPATAPSRQPVTMPSVEAALQTSEAAAKKAPPSPPAPLPSPVLPLLELRTQGALARFVPQWRIRR